MSFYEEFKNLTSDTDIINMAEFTSVAVGTKIERNTGQVYEKVESGAWVKVQSKFYDKIAADERFVNAAGDTTISGDIVPQTNGIVNFGSKTNKYNTMYAITFDGTATAAQYADLAEKYLSDKEYPVGTVMEIGGEKEITIFNGGPLAGVISGKPGFMLNKDSEGQFVALKGKVPVFCEGEVKKGQYCIAINGGKIKGVDKKSDSFNEIDIVGIALEDSKDGEVMVKV